MSPYLLLSSISRSGTRYGVPSLARRAIGGGCHQSVPPPPCGHLQAHRGLRVLAIAQEEKAATKAGHDLKNQLPFSAAAGAVTTAIPYAELTIGKTLLNKTTKLYIPVNRS